MSDKLPDNPYALGTVACMKFEKDRNPRDYDRLGKALVAWIKSARKRHSELSLSEAFKLDSESNKD